MSSTDKYVERLLNTICDDVWNAVIANRPTMDCIRILRGHHGIDLANAKKVIDKMREVLGIPPGGVL